MKVNDDSYSTSLLTRNQSEQSLNISLANYRDREGGSKTKYAYSGVDLIEKIIEKTEKRVSASSGREGGIFVRMKRKLGESKPDFRYFCSSWRERRRSVLIAAAMSTSFRLLTF